MKAIGNRKTSARHLTRDYARVFYLAEGVSNKAYQAYELIGGDHTLIYVADATLGNLMVTRMVGTDHQYLLHTSIHDGACKEYSLKILDSVKHYGELKFVRIINTSALTPLFVARGAVYNATTGYYELNGLTDITEVQMIAIYNYTSQSPNGNNWNSVFWYTMGVRTNFGLKAIVGQVNDMYGAFSQSSFEVINLECLSYKSRPTKVKDLTSTFDLCLKLKKIIGVIDVSAITTSILTGLYRAPLLEDVLILRLNVSISFEQSVNLSKKTLQYLITEATNTTPITVTVNSAVYAKLTDPTNAEWYAINTMAVAKNIAFAK